MKSYQVTKGLRTKLAPSPVSVSLYSPVSTFWVLGSQVFSNTPGFFLLVFWCQNSYKMSWKVEDIFSHTEEWVGLKFYLTVEERIENLLIVEY